MIKDGIEYLDEDLETFPDGSVYDAVLARDCEIQGIPCAGGRAVVYHPGGRLRLAWLSRETVIGEVSCAPGIIYLHEDGTVFNATLARRLEEDSVVVEAGSRVTMTEGTLLEYSRRLAADETIGGLPCSAVYPVWLYGWGEVSSAVLAQPATVEDEEYPRGTELLFDAVGQLLKTRWIDLDGPLKKHPVFGGIGDLYQE